MNAVPESLSGELSEPALDPGEPRLDLGRLVGSSASNMDRPFGRHACSGVGTGVSCLVVSIRQRWLPDGRHHGGFFPDGERAPPLGPARAAVIGFLAPDIEATVELQRSSISVYVPGLTNGLIWPPPVLVMV